MTEDVDNTSSTLRPRDAATLILIDTQRSPPRIFMGRRNPKQVFMPDKFVFPGGRLDRADRYIKPTADLSNPDLEKLLIDMKGKPSKDRARAIALAAIRETFEETGLLVATKTTEARQTSSHPVWQQIFDEGYAPSLEGLRFLARAITPPGRTRRYDTRFFCVNASRIVGQKFEEDGELLDQDWFAIPEARMLDMPHITRAIVEDIDERLQSGGIVTSHDPPVPYYYFANGAFERELLRTNPNAA